MNRSSPELLESRIAPAGFSFPFTDVDGDQVMVTISKGKLADATFTLSQAAGPFAGQQLQQINLNGNAVFAGASITVTAKLQDADNDGALDGDGRVNVGLIESGVNGLGRLDLTSITVGGDLGSLALHAGQLKTLSVGSLGEFGTSTGASTLHFSVAIAPGGSVKIAGDIAAGSKVSFLHPVPITIGGSVRGQLGEGTNFLGAVKIAGDVTGSIYCGALTSLQIGGSLIGGEADKSGYIRIVGFSVDALRTTGLLGIGGSILGGAGLESGKIETSGHVAVFRLGGSIVGGSGSAVDRGVDGTDPDNDRDGQLAIGGKLSTAIIGGSLRGAAGDFTGLVQYGELGKLTLGGSLIGGHGASSGGLLKSANGPSGGAAIIAIAHDVIGGSSPSAGRLSIDGTKSVVIGGALIGGTANFTGQIIGKVENITVGGDVIGGSAFETGHIISTSMKTVVVKGSLIAGNGQDAGTIQSLGSIGRVSIGGDIRGATLEAGHFDNVTVGGSLLGRAVLHARADIVSLSVRGSLLGSATVGDEVTIMAGGIAGLPGSSTADLAIGKLTVGGSVVRARILAGTQPDSSTGDRNNDAQIGSVMVGGDWEASVLIAGVDDGPDDIYGNNNDAKYVASPNYVLKDRDDALGHLSRIGSVTIKGAALGTPDSNDGAVFAIEAQHVAAISVGGVKQVLIAGPGTDTFNLRNPLGATLAGSNFGGDFSAIEIAAPHAAVTLTPIVAPRAPVNTFTYTDVDGDLVSVRVSKGTLGDLLIEKVAAGVLGGEQLRSIDLQGRSVFQNATITVTAQPQDANHDGYLDGDGLVNVGEIKAAGVPLAGVTIRGDLGAITAGGSPAVALGRLTVSSLGRFGTSTGAAATFSDLLGELSSVSVTTDLAGVLKAFSLGTMTISGSLTGDLVVTDTGVDHLTLRKLSVGGDLRGVVDGRSAGTVTIGGSIYGDASDRGQLRADGTLGFIKIGGDLRGDFPNAGHIFSSGDLASLTIGRSFIGLGGFAANVDIGGKIGSLTIGNDIRGSGIQDATISATGPIAKVTIGGSISGTGLGAATLQGSALGPLKIGGDVRGDAPNTAGLFSTGGNITSLTIGGSFIGGNLGGGKISAQGDILALKIVGDVRGGGFTEAGYVRATGALKSLTIGGSILGGMADRTGAVITDGAIGAVTIGGDLRGGSLAAGGSTYTGSAYFEARRIASFTVRGSIVAGDDESNSGDLQRNASLRVADDLGALTVGVNVSGTVHESGGIIRGTQVVISARGQAIPTARTDLAIGKISIGGRLEETTIQAGYTPDLLGVNADAQIGAVTVGDWRASYLIAGVQSNGNGFGDADDAKLSGPAITKDLEDSSGGISRIASLTIKGAALGSLSASDPRIFVIVAQQIGAVKIGLVALPLLAGPSNDRWPANAARSLGPTTDQGTPDGFDFHVFEVG